MKLHLYTVIAAITIAGSGLSALAQKPGHGAPTRQNKSVGPVVTQIDVNGLKALLKPDGKPRLINFWATWCDPCREEFPELVKLDGVYKGKIDFISVSLDDVEDIATSVPKFLAGMKSTMPPYLLRTADEDAAIAAISSVSSDFHGSLPFTILINSSGEIAYSHAGKINPVILNTELEKQVSFAK